MNRRLIAIITLFVTAAWLHGRALPILEGGDEWLQLAYVEHLRATGTLPDRAASQTSPVRQQSGQPPLTYAVSALPLILLNVPPIDTQAVWDGLQRDSNNWFTPPDRFNRRDNNNVFYLSNAPASNPDVVAAVRAVRWLAPVYGVVAIIAAYGAAWEVFRARGWALTAAALFAFTPSYVHANSFLTTDGGAAMFGTLLVWLALVTLRHGASWQLSLLTGLTLGLAGLAKVSTLLLAPTVGLALLLAVIRERGGRGAVLPVIGHGALVAVPFALTFGVWVGWGWLAYGDPVGTATHRFPGHFYDPPLGVAEVLARLPEVYLSYWGKFASAVYLHPATYLTLTVILLGINLGYMRVYPKKIHTPHIILLEITAASMLAGVWYWVATVNFITGRLLFPAHIAYVMLLTGGAYTLAGRSPKLTVPLRALLVVPAAVTSVIIAPAVIDAAYSPPDEADIAAVPLTQTPFVFDATIQLVGWHTDADAITSGELVTVTLCWRVLAATARPAAYAFRMVKDGVPVGERTTVHGLGRYDSAQWTPGYAFCDALDVPVSTVEPGMTYDLLLVMLDAQTGAVNWRATTPDGVPVAFPVLGQVVGR